jgi:hypothetical protein
VSDKYTLSDRTYVVVVHCSELSGQVFRTLFNLHCSKVNILRVFGEVYKVKLYIGVESSKVSKDVKLCYIERVL